MFLRIFPRLYTHCCDKMVFSLDPYRELNVHIYVCILFCPLLFPNKMLRLRKAEKNVPTRECGDSLL